MTARGGPRAQSRPGGRDSAILTQPSRPSLGWWSGRRDVGHGPGGAAMSPQSSLAGAFPAGRSYAENQCAGAGLVLW